MTIYSISVWSQGLALDGHNDLFDEMLVPQGEAETNILSFLQESPRGEDAAGAKIIFWEETRELEREILIKVGQFIYYGCAEVR